MRSSTFGTSGDTESSLLGQMMRQQELMSSGQTSVWATWWPSVKNVLGGKKW